ncbi:hydroxyacylglutathione hydrolase [Hartmannibacter diazotrophicus]|uniref:Hydroxyacylglutathione hydrolase n=1 Tax=Hartmannibacter diazotrophicus TaxID=1482074 RepID=A0A2C9D4R4_9HYPH|nr:MBL fold metallo-hydrolase [Hartmannibacter diazotrophicus]SON54761.1 hydroxyacylglutathione hydrolase [Hartmannibacter diazotrophicus]
MTTLSFNRDFDPRHGEAVEIAPGLRRITAPNASPFTFRGTNTYLVGTSELAVVDPGPEDDGHLEAILAACGGRPVSHILVTHTHRDHSPLAARLKERTGALTVGEGPHRPAHPLPPGESNPMDASGDRDFHPDLVAGDADLIETPAGRFRVVATPGHTENHLAFALEGGDVLFSGDHVMAWSTTIVAPPDGSMANYMASLDRLLAAPETTYLPGHGGELRQAHDFVRGLIEHRRGREVAILAAITMGARSTADIVSAVYVGLDPSLFGAARLSVLAHLEDLAARGLVATEGAVRLEGRFEPP